MVWLAVIGFGCFALGFINTWLWICYYFAIFDYDAGYLRFAGCFDVWLGVYRLRILLVWMACGFWCVTVTCSFGLRVCGCLCFPVGYGFGVDLLGCDSVI